MPRGVDRRDEALRQGRLWTPNLLRGLGTLQSWFDADDLSTIAYSTGVTTWADKSGLARDVTAASNLPTLSPLLNARNGIKFTTAQRLSSASWTLAQPLSLFIVWLQTDTSNVNNFIKGKNDAGYSGGFLFQTRNTSPSTTMTLYANGASSRQAAAVNAAAGTQYLHFSVYNAASSEYALNGNARATVSGGTIGGDGVITGITINSPSSNPWAGTCGEVIILSGVAPRYVQEVTEGYLAWKWWGQENILAASHPFKNRPPLIGD